MGFCSTSLPRMAFFFASIVAGGLCCDRCVYKSKASYFVPPMKDINERTCGYGAFAASFSKGAVATASPKIYRSGLGCGACYQIRCTDTATCTKSGVKVVITDFTEKNHTDFVLPPGSFSGMAKPNNAAQLMKMGAVGIEYQRIPCEYPGKNLGVRVDKSSVYPDFLALQFVYQGGQTDIQAVEVTRMGSPNWQDMSRMRGRGVWSLKNPPRGGPLSVKLIVTGGFDGSTVYAKKGVLPEKWVPDSVYDAGVQITEIAQEGCFPCPFQKDWQP